MNLFDISSTGNPGGNGPSRPRQEPGTQPTELQLQLRAGIRRIEEDARRASEARARAICAEFVSRIVNPRPPAPKPAPRRGPLADYIDSRFGPAKSRFADFRVPTALYADAHELPTEAEQRAVATEAEVRQLRDRLAWFEAETRADLFALAEVVADLSATKGGGA